MQALTFQNFISENIINMYAMCVVLHAHHIDIIPHRFECFAYYKRHELSVSSSCSTFERICSSCKYLSKFICLFPVSNIIPPKRYKFPWGYLTIWFSAILTLSQMKINWMKKKLKNQLKVYKYMLSITRFIWHKQKIINTLKWFKKHEFSYLFLIGSKSNYIQLWSDFIWSISCTNLDSICCWELYLL